MSASTEQLYQQRLRRYLTAMRNEKPDRVPVRPFAAEMTATHCGFTCQQVTHDYRMAFEAVIRCCKDYDWDAAVANMVYVWTGLSQALGLKYYGIPGLEVPPDTGFQYREPGEDDAFMHADEYDALIADPTGFLYETWLPRISTEIAAPGAPNSTRSTLALVKGSMAMLAYFMDFGPQVQRMRQECGTVSAIAGILKAPMDILADKLRGYLGLATDLIERPEKVKAACEALLPHLFHVANTTADDPDSSFYVVEVAAGTEAVDLVHSVSTGRVYTVLFADGLTGREWDWQTFADTNAPIGTWIETNPAATTHAFVDDFGPATSGSQPTNILRVYTIRVSVPEP